uniref:Uncharacterized protein n=1 Tax=Setaria italica TaxID=4555 RepID=K4ANM4_SETIT
MIVAHCLGNHGLIITLVVDQNCNEMRTKTVLVYFAIPLWESVWCVGIWKHSTSHYWVLERKDDLPGKKQRRLV